MNVHFYSHDSVLAEPQAKNWTFFSRYIIFPQILLRAEAQDKLCGERQIYMCHSLCESGMIWM